MIELRIKLEPTEADMRQSRRRHIDVDWEGRGITPIAHTIDGTHVKVIRARGEAVQSHRVRIRTHLGPRKPLGVGVEPVRVSSDTRTGIGRNPGLYRAQVERG